MINWAVLVAYILINYVATVRNPVEELPEVLLLALVVWLLLQAGLMTSSQDDEDYAFRRARVTPVQWALYAAAIGWGSYMVAAGL
ncbi:MAG: hypothetical protein P1U64_13190 [Alcanivoracaceae bacterium]|nr:hypothetical protein [Alcanivoracaceae bacterium]